MSRDIAVTVKTASGLAVIRRFNSEEKRLTIGVCGQLRGEHGEDGDVGMLSFQSTGCEVPRDPMHIMEAGAYTFKLSRRIPDTKCNLDHLLGAPLSAPLAISGNGAIDAKQRDKEGNTHPTTVLRFDDWEEVVVAEMDSLPESYKAGLYDRIGEKDFTCIRSEAGIQQAFQGSACARVNHLHQRNGLPCYYSPQPSMRLSETELRDRPAGLPRLRTKPDNLMWDLRNGAIHDVLEFKGGDRLSGVTDRCLAFVWNEAADMPDPTDAHWTTLTSVSQILGYLSDLGLMYGTLSTYTVTWLVKTDGRGTLWISDPIPYDRVGSATRASVTQVLLFSARMNMKIINRQPYNTAFLPREIPIDRESKQAGAAALRLPDLDFLSEEESSNEAMSDLGSNYSPTESELPQSSGD